MSVTGFDVGNDCSCVAVARRAGIDVLLNKESKRETPGTSTAIIRTTTILILYLPVMLACVCCVDVCCAGGYACSAANC
jgi:hypothetical protein